MQANTKGQEWAVRGGSCGQNLKQRYQVLEARLIDYPYCYVNLPGFSIPLPRSVIMNGKERAAPVDCGKPEWQRAAGYGLT